jgi:hypothetical protein
MSVSATNMTKASLLQICVTELSVSAANMTKASLLQICVTELSVSAVKCIKGCYRTVSAAKDCYRTYFRKVALISGTIMTKGCHMTFRPTVLLMCS